MPEYLCAREEESAKPEQHTIASHGQHHHRTSEYWHQYHLLSQPESLRIHGEASSLGMISESRNGTDTGRRDGIQDQADSTCRLAEALTQPREVNILCVTNTYAVSHSVAEVFSLGREGSG